MGYRFYKHVYIPISIRQVEDYNLPIAKDLQELPALHEWVKSGYFAGCGAFARTRFMIKNEKRKNAN